MRDVFIMMRSLARVGRACWSSDISPGERGQFLGPPLRLMPSMTLIYAIFNWPSFSPFEPVTNNFEVGTFALPN